MISFPDLLSAIRHRFRLVVVVGAAVFLVVAAIGFLQPRQYSAGSSLLIDLTQRDPTAGSNNQASDNVNVIDTVIGTQVDILRSNAVLEEVARRDPLFNTAEFGDTPDERTQKAITLLRRELLIATDKGSNVIRLSYTSGDAATSARILNLIVDVFLAKQVTLRTMPARSNAKWFDARTRDVRMRFEAAQKRLSDFQREHGIVGVDRMDLEADKARNLSTELVQAQAEAAAARSRSGSSTVPEVAGSTIVQDLQREAGIQAGKVAELSKTLGPNHPDMIAANAQLAALRGQLGNARSVQAQALTAASGAAARREASLRADLAEQQTRMLSLSGVQDQLNVLQRDVDAARQTYDTVRQRFNEAALQSEISQANASRLDRADVPILPSKPNLILWLVAAVILGGFSGLGAAAGREILRPRVRTPGGAAQSLDLDVIVDMTDIGTTHSAWRAPTKEAIA